ncbi:bifunctional DNA-formamidopyrimidine glycosylase/DNA-(apurinic or apyrimidinic site) lyase [Vibrio sp. JC009]|uniref:bifunctional DNA-formamidopyrimidine glycosylase/DNA-(apurinic or apyrimidinic site) lyase n=1 Tax=Vibrio sp. JC009 TaxID=2912314 RepID=UPI0023AE961E|nr:bifunctional DNA-formamidopyrimidine glycosylase/DNA-(apurinic or apyrimidinic site) lyase [Vibrio sp. JC009]WED21965.1 bifunctional DNA-formamidopyrimidine glycosylase/DNA-(apurinic or apyrimidinic site) lyase [Vibrio sp. JC009]
MPELPEVEVSRLGITPHLKNQTIKEIIVRQPKLRWMVPGEISQLSGQKIIDISRRAKYLLIRVETGTVIVHLGMSGSLRVLDNSFPTGKHDHVDLVLSGGKLLRYNDPRRFGAWLWQEGDQLHELLGSLGPEPLETDFSAEYMLEKAKNKRTAVKQFIMDNKIVVGVGNIYANESLFSSGIHPQTPAGTLKPEQWTTLVAEIKQVLKTAIKQGGTTLKDFTKADGKPGYFAQELQMYGKAGEPCPVCGSPIQQLKIGQRNSYFCADCQPKIRP